MFTGRHEEQRADWLFVHLPPVCLSTYSIHLSMCIVSIHPSAFLYLPAWSPAQFFATKQLVCAVCSPRLWVRLQEYSVPIPITNTLKSYIMDRAHSDIVRKFVQSIPIRHAVTICCSSKNKQRVLLSVEMIKVTLHDDYNTVKLGNASRCYFLGSVVWQIFDTYHHICFFFVQL